MLVTEVFRVLRAQRYRWRRFGVFALALTALAWGIFAVTAWLVAMQRPDGLLSAPSMAAGPLLLAFCCTTVTVLWFRVLHRENSVTAYAEHLREMLGQAMQASAAGVVLVDAGRPELPIIYVNRAFSRITGYAADEALGRNARFLHGPGTNQSALDEVRRAIDAEQPSAVRLLNYRKDGTTFWNDLRISPIRDRDGRTACYLGLLVDVTQEVTTSEDLARANSELERQMADRTADLRKRKRHLQAILDSTADMVITIDQSGRVTSFNAAAEAALGWREAEILGQDIATIAAEPDRSLHPRYIERYLTTGESQIMGVRARELLARRKDGTILPVELTIGEVHDNGTRSFVGVMRDITERRSQQQRLEASEKRLRALAAATPFGLCLSRLENGEIVYVNEALARMHGSSARELIGRRATELYHDASDWLALVETLRRDGQVAETELQCRRGDGRPVWLMLSAALTDIDGTPAVITGICDISQRRDAEARLRDTAQLLALAQRLTGLGRWEVILPSGGLKWSEETYRIFQVDPASGPATLADFYGMIHPDDLPAVQAAVAALAESGAEYDIHHRIVRRDGSVRILHQLAQALKQPDSDTIRIVGTVQDVTEARETEDALRRSEQELRLVADNLPMIVTYVDRRERYRFANRTAALWYGRPVTELIGRKVSEILLPESYAKVRGHIRRALAGESARFEETMVYPGGDARRVEVQYVPHRLADGHLAGFFTVVTDMTERTRMEEQIRQSQRLDTIGQLTGGIAHDFNNFLGVIIGNLDLAARQVVEQPRAHELIERAVAGAQRAAALVQRLLSFSRRQSLQPTDIDVNCLVQDLAALAARSLGDDVRLTLDLAPGAWACRADRVQLESALMNLAMNARDAMPFGGNVRISTFNRAIEAAPTGEVDLSPGDYVEVLVSDDGVGMDPAVLRRAFEPFFTTKEVGAGTGLGLSMVYGFARQSGGGVRIESSPGRGTTVHLLLPRASGDNGDACAAGETNDGSASERRLGKGRTVLVVEDDVALRRFSVYALQELGFSTVEATRADEGLAALHAHPEITILFSDVMLPGGNSGLDLAREAKATRPDIIILFTSGYVGKYANLGENLLNDENLLLKPFRVNDLAGRLTRLLAEAGP